MIVKQGPYQSVWDEIVAAECRPATFTDVCNHIADIAPRHLSDGVKGFNRITYTPDTIYVELLPLRNIHCWEQANIPSGTIIPFLESRATDSIPSAVTLREPLERNTSFPPYDLFRYPLAACLAGFGCMALSTYAKTNGLDIYVSGLARLPSPYACHFPKLHVDFDRKKLTIWAGGYLVSYDDPEEWGIGLPKEMKR